MSQKRNMVIHFMDGTKVSYYFPKQVDPGASAINRMKKVMEHPYIIVSGDGAISFYPTNNIKSIQLYPAPDHLPDFVIQDAELV